MAFRIVQISDLHFGTEVEDVVLALQKTIRELAPNMILVTGDITQRATRAQFSKARVFFESLSSVSLLYCPGNHDISLLNVFSRLFFPYYKYRKILKAEPEGFYSQSDAEILMLNSTSRFRHIDGKLPMGYLEEQLKKFSPQAKWRVVATHHPLDCKQSVDEKNILLNAPEVMHLLAEKGVHMVVGGHIHDPFITTSAQRYPQLSQKVLISVCGTGVSSRTRRNAPNSFMVYDLASRASTITNQRFDYENTTRLFKVVSERVF